MFFFFAVLRLFAEAKHRNTPMKNSLHVVCVRVCAYPSSRNCAIISRWESATLLFTLCSFTSHAASVYSPTRRTINCRGMIPKRSRFKASRNFPVDVSLPRSRWCANEYFFRRNGRRSSVVAHELIRVNFVHFYRAQEGSFNLVNRARKFRVVQIKRRIFLNDSEVQSLRNHSRLSVF